MARKKQVVSEWVKAAGRLFEFVQAISQAVHELGGSDADLDRLPPDFFFYKTWYAFSG